MIVYTRVGLKLKVLNTIHEYIIQYVIEIQPFLIILHEFPEKKNATNPKHSVRMCIHVFGTNPIRIVHRLYPLAKLAGIS